MRAAGLLLNAAPSPAGATARTNFFTRPRAPPCLRAHRGFSSATSTDDLDDLYGLLGVETGAGTLEIRKAYRALQKRCHPDIAGAAGHDMAIVLNEAYAILSDPAARSAYDKEQAKLSEFQGYTGRPLYSTWCGSDNEKRAVFVDEIKCIGCLKCALVAKKTFAVESAYGRARVIAQWADSEDKISEAIQTCPVDCISIVERSNLAALEYLMSKEPRGNVRITAGNTVGVRVSNIFAYVDKFQRRYNESKENASNKNSKYSNLQRDSRISAMESIRSILNWWYWQPHTSAESTTQLSLTLTDNTRKASESDTERIKEAAAKRKARQRNLKLSTNNKNNEEYWRPMVVLPSPANTSKANLAPLPKRALHDLDKGRRHVRADNKTLKPVSIELPALMGVVSAVIVGIDGREVWDAHMVEHVGGKFALDVVNSFELQVLLAGVTWFVIGMAVMGMVELLENLGVPRK